MRQFQAIIGLLALVTIGAQTLRHAYVLLIEPRESVLDKYEPAKQDIAETQSLEELITLYEAAQKTAEEFRKNNLKQPDEEPWEYESRLRAEEPAFQSTELLEDAISEWESHNQQLYELHFFWLAGVVVLIIGTVIYLRVQRWAGILCMHPWHTRNDLGFQSLFPHIWVAGRIRSTPNIQIAIFRLGSSPRGWGMGRCD